MEIENEGNLDEVRELERLAQLQLRRVHRLAELEEKNDAPIAALRCELETAGRLVGASLKAKVELGLLSPVRDDAEERLREILSVSSYSDRTVAVLRDPEKRHRIIGLLERLGRLKALPEELNMDAEVVDRTNGNATSSRGNGRPS